MEREGLSRDVKERLVFEVDRLREGDDGVVPKGLEHLEPKTVVVGIDVTKVAPPVEHHGAICLKVVSSFEFDRQHSKYHCAGT